MLYYLWHKNLVTLNLIRYLFIYIYINKYAHVYTANAIINNYLLSSKITHKICINHANTNKNMEIFIL
jgi:hypothetical protein